MVNRHSKTLAIIALIAIPIVIGSVLFDAGTSYLITAQDLRPDISTGFGWPKPKPDYLITADVSVEKTNFGDRYLDKSFTFTISGNYTPSLFLASFNFAFQQWDVSRQNLNGGSANGPTICGANHEDCTTWLYDFTMQEGSRSILDWQSFGVLNAPLDSYLTLPYCVALDRPFAFQKIKLKFNLLSGYLAGIENYTEIERSQIPADLALQLPTFISQISCFQILIARDPTSLVPVAVYSILPPFILYFVAMTTLFSVPKRENRLVIYSGILFATFGYFLSVRQLLETPISWLELSVVVGLTLWILAEAGSTLTRQPNSGKTS